MNIQVLADQLLLQNFSPPGVLVNDTGDIIYISGHTGKYLEPAVGKANMNIFAMLREGLRDKFPSAFRQAIMKKEVVVLQNIKVDTNGGTQILDVTIQWIDKPEPLKGMVMIIFTDLPMVEGVIQSEKKKRIHIVSGNRSWRKSYSMHVKRCKAHLRKCKLRRKN